MARKKQFTEQLRAAVLNADESRYRISKDTGIPEGNLSRFVHGDAWLSAESLDLICEYLGLELTKRKSKSKPKAKGK
ncbi:MAG: helix-turn-helix domain-containing protein [Pirellulales bacterium]|nr:helix-turn-helix domain-containing protein [Pirellulales bacterium]